MIRILVVDDSPSALQTVETILTEAGYQVHTCSSGECAARKLQREAFDLIVTDIYMPDRDGLEVIQDARRTCPDVPIVAMSGITGEGSMLIVARHMGACQILQKPFSRADLLATVGAALGTAPRPRPGDSGTPAHSGAGLHK